MLLDNQEFEFSKETDASTDFLILNLDADAHIQDYQVQMLAKNPNSSILPLNVRRIDNKFKIYYDISTKITLGQLLIKRRLKRSEFIDLLSNIIKTILESKNYLLNENSFIINEEFIYINSSTLQVSLIYLPLMLQQDSNKQLKAFVTNLIVYTVQIDETATDNSLQRMLNLIKSDNFNLLSFQKLLEELRGKKETIKPIKEEPEVHKEYLPVKIVSPKSNEVLKKSSERKELFSILSMQILSLIVFLLLILILYCCHKLDVISCISIILMTAAMDALLTQKLIKSKEIAVVDNSTEFQKTCRESYALVKSKAQSTPASGKLKAHVEEAKQTTLKTELLEGCSTRLNEKSQIENPGTSQSTMLHEIESLEETVVIRSPNKMIPFLKCMQEGSAEKISLTKFPFVIGRSKEQADYVLQNNAVGKRHAEITYSNRIFYIRDLNSKNGTFINGFRISSQLEQAISNNDRLTLADIEFYFYCT